MTGRPQTTPTRQTAWLHPAQAEFLVARLNEDLDAALLRPLNEPALQMMTDLRATIASNGEPDQVSIDVLTVAYAGHPEFRTDWNKQRCA